MCINMGMAKQTVVCPYKNFLLIQKKWTMIGATTGWIPVSVYWGKEARHKIVKTMLFLLETEKNTNPIWWHKVFRLEVTWTGWGWGLGDGHWVWNPQINLVVWKNCCCCFILLCGCCCITVYICHHSQKQMYFTLLEL